MVLTRLVTTIDSYPVRACAVMLLTGCATPTLYDNPPTEKTSSVSLQAVGLKGHVVYVNDFLWVHVLDKSGSRIGSIKLTPGEPTDLIHIEQNREVVLNYLETAYPPRPPAGRGGWVNPFAK